MDANTHPRDNPLMGRYRFTAYKNDSQPRYIVVWGPRREIIDCQRLEPAMDLRGAMTATIARLAAEGWQAEGGIEYGFVFIRREGERRLLSITELDPYSTAAQSFSPFRSEAR
jgi:hypothetical protein